MKKLAILLAAALAFSALPLQTVFAASDNYVTRVPAVIPIDTLFIESDSRISRSAGIDDDDIAYIMDAPYLVLELEDDMSENSAIKLTLSRAKWFFRDDSSTERFEDGSGLLGDGRNTTYDDTKGSWTPSDGEKSTGGFYERTTNVPAAGVETDDIVYQMDVSGANDAEAIVTFHEGGFKGDKVFIPLIARTIGAYTFTVAVDGALSPISSGKYDFASADANYKGGSEPAKSSDDVSDDLRASIKKELEQGGGVMIELSSQIPSVLIDRDIMDMFIKHNQDLIIGYGEFTAAIHQDALKNDQLIDTKKLLIAVKPVQNLIDAGVKSEFVSADAANEKLNQRGYNVKLTADGSTLSKLNGKMTVGFDLYAENLGEARNERLTVLHFESGTKYEALESQTVAGAVSAATDKLGDFGVTIAAKKAPEPPKAPSINLILTIGSTAYILNGVQNTTDVAPAIISDRTMVPIRFVSETLAADVSWDDDAKTATITKGDTVLTLTLDVLVPGMGVAPALVDDRILVPISYISQNLGATLEWNDAAKTVTITAE